MAGQGNDFFLQFGSDAEPFSRQLAADLDPGIAKINALREALLQYEETAGNIKGGSSPLGITFEGLDQAAQRLEAASRSFSSQMKSQIDALGTKITGLSETLNAVLRSIPRGGVPVAPPTGGGRPQIRPPQGVPRRGENWTPEQLAILQGQRRAPGTTGGISQVTPAEQAAAQKTRTSNRQAAEAANKAADANGVSAKQINATVKALGSLNDQLKGLIETAKQLPSSGVGKPAGDNAAAANADAVLQIGNTTANPIPVVVVGGEAQAVTGSPAAGHQTHIPHATTATQTAKAQEEVAAAAELSNAPNSFKNPRRVMPGDTVTKGEWWLLPGQDKPTRAFGIRKGETVGEYSSRVEGARQRAEAALATGPRLDDRSAEILRQYQEGHGRLPLPRMRVLDKMGGVVGSETTSAYAGYPDNIARILAARDEFANKRLDMGHTWALSELRNDPMLTQDSLPQEAKAALARIDSILAGTSRKTVVDQLFEGAEHPDLATLRKGALNRNRLRDQGREAAEEARLAGNAEAAIVGKAGKRDPITGEWIYAREDKAGMIGVNERRDVEFRSNIEQAEIAERNASPEAQAERAAARRRSAQSSTANADTFAGRLNRLEDRGGYFVDPADVDENGEPRRYTIEQLRREYQNMTTPLRRDLTEGIRRNKRNADRNRGSNQERYEKYTSQVNELSALRDSLTPGTAELPPEVERFNESKSTLADLRRRITRDDLARQDKQGALSDNERRSLEQDYLYQDYLHSQLPKPAPRLGNAAELEKLRTAAAAYQQYSADRELEVTEASLAARPAPEPEPVPEQPKASRKGRRKQEETSSKTEQGGTRIKRGQSINLHTGQVEDENGRPIREEAEPGLNLPGAEDRHARRRGRRTAEEEHDWSSYDSSDIHQRQEMWEEDAARINAAGGGRKPPKPPRKPPAATPAPEPEPEPQPAVIPPPTARRPARVRPLRSGTTGLSGARQNQWGALDPETRAAIQAERARIAAGGLSPEEQAAALGRAAYAFRGDYNVTNNPALWGRNSAERSTERVRALTGMLGLDEGDSGTRGSVQRALMRAQQQHRDEATSQVGRITPGMAEGANQAAQGTARLADASERAARMEELLAMESGKVRDAMLAEAIAAENLSRVRAQVTANPGAPGSVEESQQRAAIARAELQYSQAQRNSINAQNQTNAEANKSKFATITGRRAGTTFSQDLLRHGSYALENTIGYSLVFTGFEKLRELVQTGIEAQAVFVRLQASLDANGIAVGNLQTKLTQISATTATPLEQVTEAAAELAGSFNDVANKGERLADIEFATNIASQLANISQGALTAQEAAVGLRDVFTAFGDAWAQSGLTVQQGLAQTGDQIAHLSQLTGVSVKDITEGTTQIAAEAHEFGLSQRQAATLAAYISKGTGESGEESAAQASRMLATLYNGKTQSVLEKTRIGTNADGSAKMLATQQQFEQGQVGDVLSEIAANWEKLSPRQRQSISAQMGTGIQARAFAAFVGGGANAAGEMNGSASDAGALNRQNQAYLQTVAGMIKQLDEDFQNLGNTLQRLGAFDAIGILAKSLDELLKTFNKVFGSISSLMNSNPITSGLMKWSVVILEAAAAWKLLGGAVTGAFVKMGVLRNIAPSNAAQIESAQAANAAGIATPIPRARYSRVPFRQVAGGVGSAMLGRASTVDMDRAMEYYMRPTVAERFGAMSGGFFSTTRNIPTNVRSFFNDIPGNARSLGANALAGANTFYQRAAYGRVVASEGDEAIRARQVRAAVREQGTAMRAARASGNYQASQLAPITKETQSAAKALRNFGLSAESAAVLTRTSAEEQAVAMNSLTLRMRMFGAGLVSSVAGMAAMMGMFAAISFALNQLSKASQDAQARNSAENNLLNNGSTSQKDLAATQPKGGAEGFRDWYFGNSTSTLGQLGNATKHTGEGLFNETLGRIPGVPHFSGGQAGPSDESNQLYLDLMNSVYGTGHMNKAAQKRIRDEGFVNPTGNQSTYDKLQGMSTVDEVNAWKEAEQKYIDKHAKAIEKAGGNDKNSQAQIAYSINQLKTNLQTSAQHRIAALEGLQQIDQLNANQLAALSSMAGTLSSLNADTLSSQSGAILTLLQQTGLPTGSQAYQNLQMAMGAGVPIDTLGINDKGEIGQYSADGTWHPATKQQTAGIGPTEGSKLPQLGKGPGVAGSTARYAALQQAYQEVITNARSKLDAGGLSADDQATYLNDLTQAMTGYQEMTQAMYQAPITQEQGRAGILASLGGTPQVAQAMGVGSGGDATAIEQLKKANDDLSTYNSHLETTDPQYWQNLQEIQQNKLQIAQLQNQPALNKLMIAAASATDATTAANLKYQQAVKQLQIDQAGGASSAQIGQDQANIASAGVGSRQAQEAVNQAQANAAMASIENSVDKARAQYAEAVREEGVYAQGGSLQDRASYLNAVAQAAQAQIAVKDALEQQIQASFDAKAAWQQLQGNPLGALYTQLAKAQQAYADAVSRYGSDSQQAQQASAQIAQARIQIRETLQANAQATFDVAAAIDTLKGDALGAAQQQLSKAQQAYRQAVTDYGKNSSQAQEALAGVYQARQQFIQAQLDQVNSFLDLDIANLNARGQAGDAQKAANDAVAKARNAINSYLKAGGKKGTKEYNDLMGQLATAQRNAFDTALQAQLDTLDFQQQTYKITSSQEVQALQQILKNKQLTLQEQRDITLKIKNLQESIRQQLTEGGLNIPSDIKLPTAYDVRRSLGAGFGGAGTQVNTVNNNQQVTVNNNVPNSAIASQIANQVITLINQQTSMGLRANSSTPRTVQTK